MKLNLQEPNVKPINVEQFQQSIKRRKNPHKNQLQQIRQYNKKTTKEQDISQNGLDSQFNINTWNQQLQNKNKIDLFDQENKQLLGDDQSIKYLNWKFILLDLLLHLITTYISLSNQMYLVFCFVDLPMIIENSLLLSDRFLKGKIFTTKRYFNHQIYQYTLIVSILGSFIFVVKGGLGLLDPQITIWQVYFTTVFYIFVVVTQWQIWKMNRYLLFITRQLFKRQSPDQLELSDTL